MITDRGVELICGISDDPQFGKYMMVGLGGVAVEVMQDVSIRLLPVAPEEIAQRRETSKPDSGIVTFSFEMLNQRGETVFTGQEKIMLKRRPA